MSPHNCLLTLFLLSLPSFWHVFSLRTQHSMKIVNNRRYAMFIRFFRLVVRFLFFHIQSIANQFISDSVGFGVCSTHLVFIKLWRDTMMITIVSIDRNCSTRFMSDFIENDNVACDCHLHISCARQICQRKWYRNETYYAALMGKSLKIAHQLRNGNCVVSRQ